MSKNDDQLQLNMSLPPSLGRGVKRLIEAGEFSTQAEYVRYLIRNDLDKRLPALDEKAAPRPER